MFEDEEEMKTADGTEGEDEQAAEPVSEREQTVSEPEPASEQALDEAFQRQVEEELREIRQYDPSIRTAKDLLRLDRRDRFFEEVTNHRHTFAEAYRFVYADRIAEAKLRSSMQQAAHRARSADQDKAHMRATGVVGTGEAAVPAQVERNIRAIMPKATAKEIRAFYQKYARQTD